MECELYIIAAKIFYINTFQYILKIFDLWYFIKKLLNEILPPNYIGIDIILCTLIYTLK